MRPVVALLLAGLAAWSPGTAWAEQPGAPARPVPQAKVSRPIRVVLDGRRRLLVGGVAVTLDTLVPVLDGLTGADRARPVLLGAGSNVAYGLVVETMERLKQGGYWRVALETLPPHRPK